MLTHLTQPLVGPALLAATLAAPPAMAESGLAVTVASGEKVHRLTLPTVALHVGAGQSPSPFLPPDKFTAVWVGSLHAELRGSYRFQAELAGSLQLEINGRTVLNEIGTDARSVVSPTLQLSKGANALKATFTSAASGDSFVRLGWAENSTNFNPIPRGVLSHAPSPAQSADMALARGRALFLERRCLACHSAARAKPGSTLPEHSMDAPALDGIGSRRHPEWMSRWILNPRSIRPSAHMPRLPGVSVPEDASAIAAYVASLAPPEGARNPPSPANYQTRQTSPQQKPDLKEPGIPVTRPESDARRMAGESLYERLRCAACHQAPGANASANGTEPGKITHRDLGAKFPTGRLAEYLLAPEAGHAWTRMPNFHLRPDEATELEDYLLAGEARPLPVPNPTAPPALLEKGRRLVQSSGCLNCHSLHLENSFRAPSLEQIASPPKHAAQTTAAKGCLGVAPTVDFGFSGTEKTNLARFLREGLDGLWRHVPGEFAERQIESLNCAACHGQIEHVPPMDLLGGKLRPEWSRQFMAGEIRHKIRFDQHPKGEPWVEARMPAFASRARGLASGLAALHGFPPSTPIEGPIDPILAEVGRTLVGREGGFSCVACHAVGLVPALEVFESEGINLAWSADRLQPSFYRRWFRNPLNIDPQTKMPMYFDDEGRSPLTDVLEGNGDAQIEAVWHYLRLRDRMVPPK